MYLKKLLKNAYYYNYFKSYKCLFISIYFVYLFEYVIRDYMFIL